MAGAPYGASLANAICSGRLSQAARAGRCSTTPTCRRGRWGGRAASCPMCWRSAMAACARMSWASGWCSTRRWRSSAIAGRPRPAWIRIGTRRSAASRNTGSRPRSPKSNFCARGCSLMPLAPLSRQRSASGIGSGGQVEPAEGNERAVRRRRPLQHAVVGHPVGREAVGVVQREREAAIDAVAGASQSRSSSGRLGEAVLVHAEVRMRVPDPDVVGERGADAREMLGEEAIEPRRGHGRTLPAGG